MGESFGFPDVCNTPAGTSTVPISYPNTGSNTQATGFSTIVKIRQQNAVHLSTSVPSSSGDEAGTAHSSIKGKVTFVVGNAKVFIEKQPAVTLTSSTTHNNSNCPSGAVIVPSDPTVTFTLAKHDAAEHRPLSARTARTQLSLQIDGAHAELWFDVFGRDLPARMHAVWRRLSRAGVERVVIDLRGNPGGELRIARELAEDLLPRGALIMELEDRDGDTLRYVSRHDAVFDGQVVLRVDATTASAAEIFAAALWIHGRAQIVGERTFGKCTAYVAGSDLPVAVCRPAGRHLHGVGIVTDS
jgi:carboxyl-terminal processing protease